MKQEIQEKSVLYRVGENFELMMVQVIEVQLYKTVDIAHAMPASVQRNEISRNNTKEFFSLRFDQLFSYSVINSYAEFINKLAGWNGFGASLRQHEVTAFPAGLFVLYTQSIYPKMPVAKHSLQTHSTLLP